MRTSVRAESPRRRRGLPSPVRSCLYGAFAPPVPSTMRTFPPTIRASY